MSLLMKLAHNEEFHLIDYSVMCLCSEMKYKSVGFN